MATATVRKTKKSLDRGIQTTADGHSGRKPGRRWWKCFLAGVVLLGMLVWFLPTIVGRTPLLGVAVDFAAADFAGTVTVDEASLGWFSKPSIVGIEARDKNDRPLVEIPCVSGSRTLVEILQDTSNLGSIRIEKPSLSVEIDEQGTTNIEKALAEYLTAEPSGPVDLELEIVDAQVSITDTPSGQTWEVDKLQFDLKLPAATSEAIALKTSGEIADPNTPGRFSATMKFRQATPDKSASVAAGGSGSDELNLTTQNVSLEVLGPILGRFVPRSQLSGRLSSTVECRFNRNTFPDSLVANFDITARDFLLTTPQLQSDKVQLERLHALGQIAFREGQVQVDGFELESDVGQMSLAGKLDLGGKPIGQSLAPLLHQDLECRAEVDLARLSSMLPDTLHIRDNTRITSGRIKAGFSSRYNGPDRIWTGRGEATSLQAENNGKNISFNQPVSVAVHAVDSPGGPVIKSLRCHSNFLTFNGAGTLDDFTAKAEFNLGQLTTELDSLVDLGRYRAAGKGDARFDWRRTRGQGFRTQGKIEIRDFRLTGGGPQELTEDRLVLAISASGQTDFTSNSRVDRASLEIAADSDFLAIETVEPIADLHGGGTWPLDLEIEGDLTRWQTRMAPWFSSADWIFSGIGKLTAEVIVSANSIDFAQLDVSTQNPRIRGPSIDVHDTAADLTVTGGRWDNGEKRLQAKSAQLAATGVSGRAIDVLIGLSPEGAVQLAADVSYQGDADRLQRWLTIDRTGPPEWAIHGRFSGQAGVSPSAGATRIDSATIFENLVATHRSGYQHREEELSLRVQGEYNPQTGQLDLNRVQLGSSLIGGNLAGRLETVNGKPDLQLDGQLDYDLDGLTHLLPLYLGEGILLAGRETANISYRGPLSLEAGQGGADFRWVRANLYGFELGPGNVKATVSGNTLHLKSPELAFSEGQLWLDAQISELQSASGSSSELHLPPGRVAQRIRINPRMCDNGLEYVAPVLAGVTSAEGRFSIELDGGRIPLGSPSEGELAGRITVDSIQVGPGPLIRELALLLGYESPARIARDSVITFRMVRGRIYHRDLELVFPDLTIRTYGSVGIGPADRKLAMMAEMPIPPKLLGQHAALDAALKNQIIRLPIGGTLDSPRIDRMELDRLTRRFVENAATNLIQDELTKGLQSLLGTQE